MLKRKLCIYSCFLLLFASRLDVSLCGDAAETEEMIVFAARRTVREPRVAPRRAAEAVTSDAPPFV